MMLVDTSAWIEFFRDRDPFASAVDAAIEANDAALCGPIITELRRGFRSKAERGRVLPLLGACHLLPDPPSLWEEAGDLGFSLGRSGVTLRSFDLLIAAYALAHSVPLLTADKGFVLFRKAGVPLVLATP
jgi:tRNA(fMet)-specific endonuclease VapC